MFNVSLPSVISAPKSGSLLGDLGAIVVAFESGSIANVEAAIEAMAADYGFVIPSELKLKALSASTNFITIGEDVIALVVDAKSGNVAAAWAEFLKLLADAGYTLATPVPAA